MSKVKTVFEVTQHDAKLKRLIGAIGTAKGEFVDVGLLEGKLGPGEIAQYGFYNEFGTKHIPSRSFIRSTFDKQRRVYEQTMAKGYDQVLAGIIPLRRVLTVLGVMASGDIKRTITTLRSPILADSTVAKKKSSNPLIDTGAMRNAVTYEVRSR